MQKAQEIYHARKDYFLSTLKRLGPLVGQKVSTPDGEGILLGVAPRDGDGFPFVSPIVECAVWFEGKDTNGVADALNGEHKVEEYEASDVKAAEPPVWLRNLDKPRPDYTVKPRMTKDNNSEFVSAVADYLRREGLQSIHITKAAVANVDIDVEGLQEKLKEYKRDGEKFATTLLNMAGERKNRLKDIESQAKENAQRRKDGLPTTFIR